MIPKNKIEEAALENSIGTDYPETEQDAFYVGAKWAEKELENLAIEFAEWILQHKDPSFGIIGGYKCPNKWMDTIQGNRIDYTTEELFEIFKQEKYGTESN